MEFETLQAERQGPVLHLQLSRPETGNAITAGMLDELLAVLGPLNDDPGIRVLILSGAGEDFCVGADRTEFEESLRADPDGAQLRVIADKASRVCQALDTAHAVTIARLHGRVIGAGLALAIFCDLRAGSDTCRFRLPEVALGVAPVWGGVLPRLLSEAGTARIRELLLTGAAFDAKAAQDLTVLHKAVAADELDSAIAGWTGPLIRRPPTALPLAKAVLNAYSRGSRLADGAQLDSHLLAASLSEL